MSLTSKKDQPTRLAHMAYRQLEDMIFSGELKGGDVLTERRLSEKLKISRTPLRDAFLVLEGTGLLRRRGARQLEVRQLSVTEYIHNLNVRRLLEPEAARLSVSRIDKKVLAQISQRLYRLLEMSTRGELFDEMEPRRVDDDLHNTIVTAADNPELASIVQDLRRRTRIFDLQRMPERFEDTCREHLEIVDAVASGNGDKAAAAMAKHIDNVKAGIVRRIQQL